MEEFDKLAEKLGKEEKECLEKLKSIREKKELLQRVKGKYITELDWADIFKYAISFGPFSVSKEGQEIGLGMLDITEEKPKALQKARIRDKHTKKLRRRFNKHFKDLGELETPLSEPTRRELTKNHEETTLFEDMEQHALAESVPDEPPRHRPVRYVSSKHPTTANVLLARLMGEEIPEISNNLEEEKYQESDEENH